MEKALVPGSGDDKPEEKRTSWLYFFTAVKQGLYSMGTSKVLISHFIKSFSLETCG